MPRQTIQDHEEAGLTSRLRNSHQGPKLQANVMPALDKGIALSLSPRRVDGTSWQYLCRSLQLRKHFRSRQCWTCTAVTALHREQAQIGAVPLNAGCSSFAPWLLCSMAGGHEFPLPVRTQPLRYSYFPASYKPWNMVPTSSSSCHTYSHSSFGLPLFSTAASYQKCSVTLRS